MPSNLCPNARDPRDGTLLKKYPGIEDAWCICECGRLAEHSGPCECHICGTKWEPANAA